MGANNVAQAFANWADLPHAAFRALAYMALTSYDKATEGRPARVFYQGREALALALGVMVPAEVRGDKENARLRRLGFARVDRALADLVAAGAVELVNRPCLGRNAEYRLNLFRRPSCTTVSVVQVESSEPVDNPGSGESMHHGERGPMHHGERGPMHHGERDNAPRSPWSQGVEEELQEEVQEQPLDLSTAVTPTRATGRSEDPDFSECGNPECAHGLVVAGDGLQRCPDPRHADRAGPGNVIPFRRVV